jgi:hypothetical protein
MGNPETTKNVAEKEEGFEHVVDTEFEKISA